MSLIIAARGDKHRLALVYIYTVCFIVIKSFTFKLKVTISENLFRNEKSVIEGLLVSFSESQLQLQQYTNYANRGNYFACK